MTAIWEYNYMPDVTDSELNHARFSPSSLKYFEACPCYQKTESAEIHPVTARGSVMHKACETGNTKGLDSDEKILVQKCLSFVEEKKAEYTARNSNFMDLSEQKLEVFDQWGYVDRFFIVADEAALFDFKFGFNPVDPAETNPQMWAYAIGIFEKYPFVKKLVLYILQPRLNYIDSAEFERSKDLGTMKVRIKSIIERAKVATPEMAKPGDQCVYCNRLATCDAVQGMTLALAKSYDLAHDAQLPDLFHPRQLATPEKRAQAQRLVPVLEAWCGSVRKHNVEFAKEGGEIPGYSLTTVQGSRRISDAIKAHQVVKDQLTHEEFMTCVTVNFKELSDQVAAKAPRGQKQEERDKLEDALTDANALSRGQESYQLRKTKTKE